MWAMDGIPAKKIMGRWGTGQKPPGHKTPDKSHPDRWYLY